MMRDVPLLPESQAGHAEQHEAEADAPRLKVQGARTYVLFVLVMALVTVSVTALCLLVIRHRLRAQVAGRLQGKSLGGRRPQVLAG